MISKKEGTDGTYHGVEEVGFELKRERTS